MLVTPPTRWQLFSPMNALLELPEIGARISPLSVEEYHQLGEFNKNGKRTELIRGIVIEKMSKSPLHAYLIDSLRQILSSQIKPDLFVSQDNPLTTSDSEPEPDLKVLPGPTKKYRNAHPKTAILAVEIAVTSLKLDRVKIGIYAEAGVQEYWIVRPAEKQVEVYRSPTPAGYAELTVVAAPAVLECAALPGVRVDLEELFS